VHNLRNVVGENDPFFEFDTFELRGEGDSDSSGGGTSSSAMPVISATELLRVRKTGNELFFVLIASIIHTF
jgi:hypothetical protein